MTGRANQPNLHCMSNVQYPAHGFPNQPSTGSSKKGLLFAGCGCLGFLALLCLSGGLFGYLKFYKPMIDFQAECEVLIAESPQVKELLGPPISVSAATNVTQNNERVVFHFPVKGVRGEGVVKIEGLFSYEGSSLTGKMTIEKTSATLEYEGETIDLSDDAIPDINMNDGSDDSEDPSN